MDAPTRVHQLLHGHLPPRLRSSRWDCDARRFTRASLTALHCLSGCYFTYFVSVLTTMEKLFHIKSAWIALLLSFSEVGQICTSLFLTYFAGRGHRPRWIACGMFLFSIAAFGSVSPHFLFRSQLYNHGLVMQSESSQMLALSYASNSSSNFQNSSKSVCLARDVFDTLGQFDPSKYTPAACKSQFGSTKFSYQ